LESGSTLRFIIPISAAGGAAVTFSGRGRLPQRPIGPYLDCLPSGGVTLKTSGGLPLSISGRLKSGIYTLPGNVSSQFITGLLFALPLLDGDSEIRLTTPLQSEGYIDLTMDIMRNFGVETLRQDGSFFVKGNQHYTSRNFSIESDWSQAAFWLAAGALGSAVECRGLDTGSRQGDRAIIDILRRFGVREELSVRAVISDTLKITGGALFGCEIDASQIPDLVPILAAVAALSQGRTVIGNAARLRIKESDRLKTTAQGLCALGANVTERDDALIIDGVPALRGGFADGAGDHRIVMALAIAATRCQNQVTIKGCEAVNKSYPRFFEDYNALGGNAHVVDVG
jgi:3-phosphoshikimate 1-carboxyvinyltransferase